MKLLLKNGTIINYANKFQEVADLLIENEKIKKSKKILLKQQIELLTVQVFI